MTLNVLNEFIKRLKLLDSVSYHFLELQVGESRDFTDDTLHGQLLSLHK